MFKFVKTILVIISILTSVNVFSGGTVQKKHGSTKFFEIISDTSKIAWISMGEELPIAFVVEELGQMQRIRFYFRTKFPHKIVRITFPNEDKFSLELDGEGNSYNFPMSLLKAMINQPGFTYSFDNEEEYYVAMTNGMTESIADINEFISNL